MIVVCRGRRGGDGGCYGGRGGPGGGCVIGEVGVRQRLTEMSKLCGDLVECNIVKPRLISSSDGRW